MNEPEAAEQRTTEYRATVRDGRIVLDTPVRWPEGTRLIVRIAEPAATCFDNIGQVIIAGFGLAGRWVADIFDRHGVNYVIIDQNPKTIATQKQLGRIAVHGDVSDPDTLRAAGIEQTSILALTIPDEAAVLRSVQVARELRPGIYIVARTNYSSSGLEAARLGADDVVKAEQAVARQFYEMLQRKLAAGS